MSTVQSVTVKGSITPAAGVLKRGEEGTFAYTARIQGLIEKGRLDVVEYHYDDEAEAEVEETNEEGGEQLVVEGLVEPKRNDSREDWAEFLAQHPGGFVTEGKNRAQLLEEYDAYNAANYSQVEGETPAE